LPPAVKKSGSALTFFGGVHSWILG